MTEKFWPHPNVEPYESRDKDTVFAEEILEKYADVLIWGLETARASNGGKYKAGDIIYVSYEKSCVKLAECLYKKLLTREMNVVMQAGSTTRMEYDFYNIANDDQLKFIGPWRKTLFKQLNGLVGLRGPASLTHLKDVDPKKIATVAKTAKPLRNIMVKREESGFLGWTLCMMPTSALARKAKMSVREYGEEIIRACFLDKDNPVKEWINLKEKAEAIKKYLNQLDVECFHVESANTDLIITPGEKRKWIGMSGHNIPSFELFISPDWRGTRGKYYANMPSLRSGNYVEGVSLVFKKGRVVEIQAEKGEDFTKKQIEMDRGASQVGEFSLTDKRFSPIRKFMANTLFDENMGSDYGNCHIAVGDSYSDAFDGDPKTLSKKLKKQLGFNDSALHWDLITTEDRTVTAHLKTGKKVMIYENGMFKY